MTTVDDILAERPSLKARAVAALEIRKEQRAIDRGELEAELAADMREWLADVCGCSEAELHDLKFTFAEITFGRKLEAATHLDGIQFVGRYKTVKTKIASTMSDDTELEDFVFYMSVRHPNGCAEVQSLADVGDYANR